MRAIIYTLAVLTCLYSTIAIAETLPSYDNESMHDGQQRPQRPQNFRNTSTHPNNPEIQGLKQGPNDGRQHRPQNAFESQNPDNTKQ